MKDAIKYGPVAASIIVVGILLLGITRTFFSTYDEFAWMIIKIGIGTVIFSYVDNVFLKGQNTKEQLSQGNVAHALYLVGFAIIIGAGIIAA